MVAPSRPRSTACPRELRDLVRISGRQALHAALLAFRHPGTGGTMRFETPLPPDLAELRQALATLE
jgi:23S rRNA pseudouridine1911/1915/1917 synthase